MSAGEKNAYYCETCGGYIVTIDIDDGVTPFMLACRVKGEPRSEGNDCNGMMESMFYPKPPWPARDGYGHEIPTEPSYEWYTPTGAELKRMRRRERDLYEHVRQGGLVLRAVQR